MNRKELRKVCGAFPTGVTIVTTTDNDGIHHSVTASSFNTVSMEPPLVLWSLSKKSGSIEAYRNAESFVIHILSQDQVDLSMKFSNPDSNKFEGVDINTDLLKSPILIDAAVYILCNTYAIYDGGDHDIMVGEIIDYKYENQKSLVFYEGNYCKIA